MSVVFQFWHLTIQCVPKPCLNGFSNLNIGVFFFICFCIHYNITTETDSAHLTRVFSSSTPCTGFLTLKPWHHSDANIGNRTGTDIDRVWAVDRDASDRPVGRHSASSPSSSSFVLTILTALVCTSLYPWVKSTHVATKSTYSNQLAAQVRSWSAVGLWLRPKSRGNSMCLMTLFCVAAYRFELKLARKSGTTLLKKKNHLR